MKFLYLLFLLISTTLSAQVDFDNYHTLQAVGTLPQDFTKRSYEKMEEDLSKGTNSDLSEREERVFYEGINYAIDDLMHSGYVVFGDSISNYINEIADKLLKNNPELRKELRFYTLKSNNTNAFSTAQGIVFVTTGLISQITSEAQLAYVLAHEIAHYTEKHVLESFSYKVNNKQTSIEHMSVYSKEKELSADKLGVQMFADAGYSKDAVKSTFDVLLYSYLPFDEVEVPLNYFVSNDSLYLPQSLFPSEAYEIKADEDEDDSKSSHPNIKTRKDAADSSLAVISQWGNDLNPLGEARFNRLRDMARFEVVRDNVMNAKYADALYTIFLMEKEYPNSTFLMHMKAQTWLGILQYRNVNSMRTIVKDKKDMEGASASIHYLLREISKDDLTVLCIRQIHDLYTAHPDDKEIGLIYERMVREIAFKSEFKIEEQGKISFATAQKRYEAIKSAEPVEVTPVSDTVTKPKSKYDKIKSKRDPNIITSDFDSSNFSMYLIPDVIVDTTFLRLLDTYTAENDSIELLQKQFDALTAKEREKLRKIQNENELRLGLTSFISVEPFILSLKKGGGIDRVKSEKLKTIVNEKMDEASKRSGVEMYNLPTPDASSDVNVFKERCLLLNFVEQMAINDEVEAFPVDFALLSGLSENYGTSKVMYSVVAHKFDLGMSKKALLLSLVFFRVGMIYLPLKIVSGNNLIIDLVVLNTDTGYVEGAGEVALKSGLNEYMIGAQFYELFKLLKSEE